MSSAECGIANGKDAPFLTSTKSLFIRIFLFFAFLLGFTLFLFFFLRMGNISQGKLSEPQTEPQTEPACGVNAYFSDCADGCPNTCDNFHHNWSDCDEACHLSCVCVDGYVLRSEHSSECIPVADCPPSNDPKCGLNEYYSHSAGLPYTCENHRNRELIDRQMRHKIEQMERMNTHLEPVGGCVCILGYVFRSETERVCIPAAECPIYHQAEAGCGANSFYTTYVTYCSDTCANYRKIENGDEDYENVHGHCKDTCICAPKYVFRSGYSGDCISQSECLSN